MSRTSGGKVSLTDLIRKADSNAVYETMPQLNEHWIAGSWLYAKNKYLLNPIGQIESEIKKKQSSNHRELGEYIAASAIVHCFDGWSYLSRAYEAELAGDPDAARHLGYYAELRAAMSILSRKGLGVFDSNNAVVTGLNTCEVGANPYGERTHTFVWNALVRFIESIDRHHSFVNAITPGGVELSEWLRPAKLRIESVELEWISNLCFDMKHMSKIDRKARNLASYSPTTTLTSKSTPVLNTMESIRELWRMCKKGNHCAFEELDKHLLRQAIMLIVSDKHDKSENPRVWASEYSKLVNKLLRGMKSIDNVKSWKSFLMESNIENYSQMISDANVTDPDSSIHHSGQVLARATLLLRIASGGANELLKNACDRKELRNNLGFWLDSASVLRKIYRAPKEPKPQKSVQQRNLDKELDTLDKLLEKHKSSNNAHNPHSLLEEFISKTRLLTKTERIFLMSMGL